MGGDLKSNDEVRRNSHRGHGQTHLVAGKSGGAQPMNSKSRPPRIETG
jgi:hypothetical protein